MRQAVHGRLETGEPEYKECWEEYLEYLAMQVANIRMAFDCDIILGGKVGRHLIPYYGAPGGTFRYI